MTKSTRTVLTALITVPVEFIATLACWTVTLRWDAVALALSGQIDKAHLRAWRWQ